VCFLLCELSIRAGAGRGGWESLEGEFLSLSPSDAPSALHCCMASLENLLLMVLFIIVLQNGRGVGGEL
jgi:hypothetical protein